MATDTSKDARQYSGFDPVPLSCRYPWARLRLPYLSVYNPDEANRVAQQLKNKGNESFVKGDYFDALWKYEHSLLVLNEFRELEKNTPVVHSNIAASCLRLGDNDRVDLLYRSEEYPTVVHTIMWYGFSHQHAHEALIAKPSAKIAHKAYYRRGESFRKMLTFSGMQQAMESFLPAFPRSDPYHEIVQDYVTCCKLQEDPDHKIFYEAIVLAVDHDQTDLLSPLVDRHVRSGFPSNLLKEAFSDLTLTPECIEYIMLELQVHSTITPHFDATSLSAITLLKRNVHNVKVYKKLIDFGLPIVANDINYAIHTLPSGKLSLFEILVQECSWRDKKKDLFEGACEEARKLNKLQFVEALKDSTKNSYEKFKEEGNSLFTKRLYEEALGKYFQAIGYCRKHNMKKEMALIRANMAQACLKLLLYNDAYAHSCECVKLDPDNHKGYYRKAESLKSLLPLSSGYGNYKNVVLDYLKCHRIQSNVDACCQAVVVAVERECTYLIPRLQRSQVKSGFSNNCLKYIINKYTITEKLLKFMISDFPDHRIMQPYDASFLKLSLLLEKTTDPSVIKGFIKCGVVVVKKDIHMAAIHIPDSQASLFEFILSKSNFQDDFLHSGINLACHEALEMKKKNIVSILVKNGSTPPPSEVLQIMRFNDDPHVEKYLSTVAVTNAAAGARAIADEGKSQFDLAGAKQHIKLLNDEAKDYFQNEQYDDAAKCYVTALRDCEAHCLVKEAGSIHSSLAHLFLHTKEYFRAFEHSSTCIRLDRNNSKGYFRRAESLKSALMSGKNHGFTRDLSYDNCIDDYKKSYKMKTELKTLMEALLLANEIGKLKLLAHECRQLPESSRPKLLCSLISQRTCKSSLLNYLMVEVWKPKSVDCSEIKLQVLLVEKKVSNLRLLASFLDSGVSISKGDIQIAIQYIPLGDIESLKLLTSKCSESDINEMCGVAFKAKKMPFVFYFVELGAKLPGDATVLLKEALKIKKFTAAKLLIKSLGKEELSKVDFASLLETNLISNHELIEMLVNAGVSLNGKNSVISTVMNHHKLTPEEKINVMCILIKGGAHCNQLCFRGTTPVHVATELAIRSNGVTKLIEAVVASPTFDRSAKHTNDKLETPIHCAAKPHLKKEISITVLTSLLEAGIYNPSARDKSKKRAIDYIHGTDLRLKKMLDEAALKFKPDTKKNQKKMNKKTKLLDNTARSVVVSDTSKDHSKNSSDKTLDTKVDTVSPHKPKSSIPEKKELTYYKMSLMEKINFHVSRVTAREESYFKEVSRREASPLRDTSSEAQPSETLKKNAKLSSPLKKKSSGSAISLSSSIMPHNAKPCPLMVMSDEKLLSTSTSELGLEKFNFDGLPWEVEITRNIIKFFKNTKKHSPTDRISAARVIYYIAEGKRNDHLSKAVGSNQKVSLYEARVTQAARILWEKAISYSSKLTGQSPDPVYTQVVRIWEVILDHDDLDRKIKYCSEQIELSYKRGYMASVRWALKQTTHKNSYEACTIRGKVVVEMPCMYTIQYPSNMKSEHEFVPAASTNETEYNVTTFYSFDTMTVKSMIAGTNDRRDYPFKEWQKEHEIIKINSKEAILLLGRSGTGKTTCCLYRLWNEFIRYWNPQSKTYRWKLPRRALISSASLEMSGNEDSESSDFSDSESERDDVFVKPPISSTDSNTAVESSNLQTEENKETVEENLHQVFVTKNYVLCDQMKKRFYSMAAAYDFMESHLPFEDTPMPTNFSSFDDLAFPAFLTARQFYTILDNSLGESGRTFFKRDSEGNLQVKVSSLDYEHEDPDVLLDFESSDSEADDTMDETPAPSSQKQHSEKWTEVTALYFKNMIWPKISHQCEVSLKDFDPMLVWIEIQSFIKGSELAIRKGSPLSFTEYREMGNRMAPNFTSHRENIYKMFKKYQRYTQNLRHSSYLFDECDLIIDLHSRLKKIKDVPWSIHSLYIDEVQDFTQAELAVFIHCCRDPNSMFFTGDTAQSIMRGIAFRFQDLRSCFHRINSKVPAVNVPQKPLSLTINYRSHSGILKLAGSIIDLISEFFKDSIDHLPEDEGMFPGPIPVFLDSCVEEDLSLLLSTNKRVCSAIEFGAHQVIIVQSKEAKDGLPNILKGAIVLTVFESKGLEFDDVLLYNFFTDSMVEEKGWRVVTSYLEMERNCNKIENESKLPGSNVEVRSREFDPRIHKSLNAELKYLYTAVTRAKCNLWVYDSNKKMRLPMLQYWHKRNAVKVVAAHGGSGKDYSLVFASNSTPEQWKAQGDNFMKKHLWEQAVLCYERAGPEHIYLVKEAFAYFHIQSAQQQSPNLFQSAALSFLERDELKHSVHCLRGAALCLKNSKPSKYSFAASLYEKLGDLPKAAQSYLKAKDLDNFSRIQESRGDFNSVIKSLHGKPFMRKRDALSKSVEYEKKGYELDQKYTSSELSFSSAKFYSEHKDKATLLEVLQYMPEQEKRVKFMKEAELFKEAFNDYASHKQYSGAYRLALAHGWFNEAIDLAEKDGDENTKSVFILHRAKSVYIDSPDDMDKNLITRIKAVTSIKDKVLQAEANLLLGMLLKSQAPCITALGTFKLLKHKAGILEAFNQISHLGKASNQEILDCCHHAKKLSVTLYVSNDMNIDVKETMKFCGLQRIGKVYLTSVFGSFWLEKAELMKYQCENTGHDIDGMIRLKDDITDAIADHYNGFISKWLKQFGLESKLYSSLQTFKLHSQLWKERCLKRQYSAQEVSSLSMREYLQTCVHFLELRLLKEESTSALIAVLLAIFSPQVSIYLPKCLNEEHVQTVRRSVNSLSCFKKWIETGIIKPSKVDPEKVWIDQWMFAWRASCVALPSMKFLLGKIGDLEEEINDSAKKDKFVCPAGYIKFYWKNEESYHHIFMLWLNSCIEIRENSRPLGAAKLAISQFMGNIAEDRRIFISVMNCVDVLSIHCTSLLAMITHANVLQNYPTVFTVPLLYKHTMQLFSHMICRRRTSDKTSDKPLLTTCVEQVIASHNNLRSLFVDCKHLLIKAMDYLVGTHKRAPRFSILNFGLYKFPKSDATRHCLILTLTLFGNLAMLVRVQNMKIFEEKIVSILKKVVSKKEDIPEYVQEMYKSYRDMQVDFFHPRNIFSLVENMLRSAKMDCTMSKLVFKRKEGHQGHIEFINHQTTHSPRKPQRGPVHIAPDVPPTHISLASLPPFHSPSGEGTLTVPIGSEREQFMSSGTTWNEPSFLAPMHESQVPYFSSHAPYLNPHAPDFSLNPNAAPYLPGFPRSAPGAHVPLMQSKDTVSHPRAPSEVPNYSTPTGVHHDDAIFPGSDQHTKPLSDATGYSPEYKLYDDLEKSGDDDMEEVHVEMDYVPQQERPANLVDPNMISEDVIDNQNNFCNACGITFLKDDIEAEEYEQNRPSVESYDSHIVGKVHSDNTIAYKRFMDMNYNDYTDYDYVDVAEEKLGECKLLKEEAETEQLDDVIDNLREQIDKYNVAVAEYKESRKWKQGIEKISNMQERMDRLLKEANDQVRATKSLNQGKMPRKDLDSGDDEDEIKKLSSEKSIDNLQPKSAKDHNKSEVRSMNDKQRSRQRKKDKKKPASKVQEL